MCTGVLVCVLPGSSLQVVVAVVVSFVFLQVYTSANPFLSAHIGRSKVIAQIQILAIFFLALLWKENYASQFGGDAISALFILAIFANFTNDLLTVIATIAVSFGRTVSSFESQENTTSIDSELSPIHASTTKTFEDQ